MRPSPAPVSSPSMTAPARISASSKADFYSLGLSGREGSREKRAALIKRLDLPERLTADALLDVLNALMSREEFINLQLCASSMKTDNSTDMSSSACPVSFSATAKR